MVVAWCEEASVTRSLDRRMFLKGSAAGVGGLTLLSSGLLAACSSDEDTSSSGGSSGGGGSDFGTLDLQLSWIKNAEFAGHYFADQNGYYTDGGFSKVNMMAGGSGAPADSVVSAGKALVGIAAPDLTAAAILEQKKQGAPQNIIIGAEFQKNPFCITSLADNPITTPEDMIGKKIGVQATNDVIWAAWLKGLGIDESEIEKVVVQFDPTPLTVGEVDGWMSFVINEPIILELEGFPVTNLMLNDFGYPMFAETYTVKAETVKNDPEKLKAFLVGACKGWQDNIKDPSEGGRLAVEVYGKDLDLNPEAAPREAAAANELIYNDDTKANGLFTMSDEVIGHTMETLALGGIEIDPEELFDTSLITQVYEENPDLLEPVTMGTVD
jgi:ABC-type nitrate/sulfonate/bicarbonate transport system substrate-binding protein